MLRGVALAVRPVLRCGGGRPASSVAFVSRVKRQTYVRQYPTVLVQPDGSTITVRYHEPRSLIRVHEQRSCTGWPLRRWRHLSAQQSILSVHNGRPLRQRHLLAQQCTFAW
ncbi:uncharacterized protein LOC144137594 isoform X2 [Haemaphysalis longicornis]